MTALQMSDDFGTDPQHDAILQYYYYIPCPTHSWFWSWDSEPGDIVGVLFECGDRPTGGFDAVDAQAGTWIEQIRVLDFAGYGTVYPGWFSLVFDAYCADDAGCPVGPSFWTSYPQDLGFGWNDIRVDPPLLLEECCEGDHSSCESMRVLITATHVGLAGGCPALGLDNISSSIDVACVMHDVGGLRGLYPRPYVSHYSTIHSGYYGNGEIVYCPPVWFPDARDTSSGCEDFGFLELAWRLCLKVEGPI